MIVEALSDHNKVEGLAIPAAGNTVVFDMDNVTNLKLLRFHIFNTGSNALDAAALEGSVDNTPTWVAIDASAVTTAFGTLAGGANATLLETTNIQGWRRIRLTVSGATGGTTVNAYVVSCLF